MIYAALPIALVLFAFWLSWGLMTHDLGEEDDED